jgi:uncharacterized RDD family membrane protein YckC/predicted RNA-binding Zn-ribbon protein involved in translation (DUF1610 family)
MFCDYCGKQNDETARFCSTCGKTLIKQPKPDLVACANCGKENEVWVKYCAQCGQALVKESPLPDFVICSHCGKQNETSARFCAQCGQNLIKSPEPAPLRSINIAPVQHAGFWRRALAILIDTILINVVTGNFVWTSDMEIGDSHGLFSLAVAWLYFALLESSTKQATLGKMVIGIVVTDERFHRISFARASGRFFGKFVSLLIIGIGFIMAAFTQRKQALHDMLADTLVVQK